MLELRGRCGVSS